MAHGFADGLEISGRAGSPCEVGKPRNPIRLAPCRQGKNRVLAQNQRQLCGGIGVEQPGEGVDHP